MPFQFTPFRSPFTDSIAERIARRGDIEAQRARQVGDANATAAFQGGNAWAGAIRGVGDVIAGLPAQTQQSRRQGVADDMNAATLRGVQRKEAGQQAVAGMMRGDQLPAGDTGPRQDSFLDANGLFDVSKITASLGQSGFGDMAPELVKGAESINDSILKHQKLEQELASTHSLLIGDLADGALKLSKAGTPLLEAMDFVVQPAIATKRISQKEYAQVRDRVSQLSPEQRPMALTALMDQAAKLGGETTLAEGATRADRYGRVIATGGEKPPTEAELALRAAGGNPQRAMEILKPAQKRTGAEQELDAYAASIGKKDASALTYADRQVFEKNAAQIRSDAAFQQHMRERTYDNAHPAPVKDADQNKLEQEYRTVLTRAMSNRSGSIGLEDAKVQQANHLLALIDASYDAKTGKYNIPRVQQTELALGLARLVSPGGTVGIQMEKEINQRTAKGDLAGALTYVTGTPMSSATQDIAQMFKDSIMRQGEVAQQNREGGMGYLRGLAPTELDEARRTALEGTALNPLRQSRIIRNTQTGERKLQISTDGGKTWK